MTVLPLHSKVVYFVQGGSLTHLCLSFCLISFLVYVVVCLVDGLRVFFPSTDEMLVQECNSVLDLQDDSLSLDYNSLPKLQDVSIQDTALPPADSPVKPADSPAKHGCQEISVQETALPSDASPVQPADSPVKPAEQQQEFAIATIWTIGACFVLKVLSFTAFSHPMHSEMLLDVPLDTMTLES